MKKATSRAELKLFQLELWLESAQLGLITSSLQLELDSKVKEENKTRNLQESAK